MVLKMDIEGSEWGVLPELEANGQHLQIDELFVEIHFKDPDMTQYGWDEFAAHTKQDAINMLRHWRALGVYLYLYSIGAY